MKKALLFFLAAAMLLPLFVACSDKPSSGTSDKSGTSTGSGTPSVTEPEETEYIFPDAVPALDFDGADFNILESSERNWFYTDDLNGEKLNDAVFERNRKLEERFHIKIAEPATVGWSEVINLASTLVPAGDDQYDMVSHLMQRTWNLMSNDVLRNVLTLPYIDIDNPWYTQGLDEAIIDGKLLFLTSDYTLSYTAATVVMYFNKTKWIDYIHSTEDLYQIVRDGKWTIDRVMEYSVDLYNDLNGDSRRDEDDFYGFAANYISSVNAWVYGANMRRIKIVGDEYLIEQDMMNEQLIDLYTKLRYLMTESKGAAAFLISERNDTDNSVFFLSGHALFSSFSVGTMTTPEMVAMEDDFGVLPVPKWNEDQQEYYTNVDNGTADVIGVLKTVKDVELVGAVIESMSALSYEEVVPLYCQSVLELRGARDPESSEMLRMVINTRVMDWETLYAGYDGWTTRQRKFVNTADCPELVSGIVSRLQEVLNIYDRTIETLLDLE